MSDASKTVAGILYVDQTDLSDGLRTLARSSIAFAPILVSAGFFLSTLFPADRAAQRQDRPGLPRRGPAVTGGHGRARTARNMAVSSGSAGGSTRWNQ
jgi:hypothetical protein